MAGPSKSYFRKTHANQIADTFVTTHPDWGTPMTIVPQFLYDPGKATMNSNGLCTANTGNVEYFSQEGSGGGMVAATLAQHAANGQGGYIGGTCDGGEKGGGPEHEMGGAQMSNGGIANADGSITPNGYHDCNPSP